VLSPVDEQLCIDRACVMQAVTGSVAQNEEQGQAVQDEARLRLFANIYSNQVAHLTTGMRIGRRLLLTFYMHTSVHPRPRNTGGIHHVARDV
jgi:hypothetical protein